jgi:hypothetical protein
MMTKVALAVWVAAVALNIVVDVTCDEPPRTSIGWGLTQ